MLVSKEMWVLFDLFDFRLFFLPNKNSLVSMCYLVLSLLSLNVLTRKVLFDRESRQLFYSLYLYEHDINCIDSMHQSTMVFTEVL